MASILKNVGLQTCTFALINASTGKALTGTNVTVYVTQNLVQALGAGTATELKVSGSGVGTYQYQFTQAETNCTNLGLLAINSSAIPVNLDFHTDVVDANNYPSVNVVDIAGTASAGAAGYMGVDWSAINAPTTSVALTKTTISTSQVVLSAGSVTGNVAGNVIGTISTSQTILSAGSVTGAVGSVTGAVGSVTGNVGGNVTGSVGSVVGNVGGTISTSQVILSAGSVTGNVAGNVVGSVASVVAPVGINWASVSNPSSIVNLSGTTISTSQTILSAASITGNVVGSVGSVTGAVGSVTGNVGGNVTGSVGSVLGNIGGNLVGTISTSQTIFSASTITGSVGSVVAAVSITSNRKKGATCTLEQLMQDSTTGAPKTGLTVATTISKDGGVPAATANSPTEIGLGQYQVVLTNTEMTMNNGFVQWTATGALTANTYLQTQP